MAVLALASWAAKQGNGFAVDGLTGQITGVGDFRRAMVLSAGDWTTFFTRPISCVFIIIAFLSLIYPFVLAHLKQRKAAKKGEQA